MQRAKVSSSEQMLDSQTNICRKQKEEYEDVMEEAEVPEEDEDDADGSDPVVAAGGRFKRRDGAELVCSEEEADFEEDPPRPTRPLSRPKRPTSLNLVASSTGNLLSKKQALLKDPVAAALAQKRLNKKRGGEDEYATDDTQMLIESSPDRKRPPRERTPKQPIAHSTPQRPSAPGRPPKKMGRHAAEAAAADISQEILSSQPSKGAFKKNLHRRPQLKRQDAIPYYDEDGDDGNDWGLDVDPSQDPDTCEDVLAPNTCTIPSLRNYSLDVPLHRPQFLDNYDIDTNNIGVGYGEYFFVSKSFQKICNRPPPQKKTSLYNPYLTGAQMLW